MAAVRPTPGPQRWVCRPFMQMVVLLTMGLSDLFVCGGTSAKARDWLSPPESFGLPNIKGLERSRLISK